MSLYLEHSDFTKARRAVFVTSVTSIVIQNMKIVGPEMELFGLKIAVEPEKIILLTKLSVVYYVYVFFTLVGQHYANFKPFSYKVRDYAKAGLTRPELYRFNVDFRSLLNEMKKAEAANSERMDFIYLWTVAYGAPMLFASAAVFGLKLDTLADLLVWR